MKPAPAPRPATLRDIATAADVSQMTVSRALAGRGRIAEDTRQRITTIAARLGYRPDPEVAKLMHHLRGRRTRRFQSVIVGLTTRAAADQEAYLRGVVTGAGTQAASRGYGFEVVHLSPQREAWPGVERMLTSRGVEGLILLPQHAPIDLTGLVSWEKFSVAAASASAIGPAVHRVMPHHFANTLLLCRTLAARGHERIGLVVSADHDLRGQHGFTAAVTWHGRNEAAHFVPPLVTTGESLASLRTWFTRHRPDVIIVNELSSVHACERLLGRGHPTVPRFAVTSLPDDRPQGLIGIDERPAAIGAAAIELLASMIERRVRGLPDSPASTLLTGCQVP